MKDEDLFGIKDGGRGEKNEREEFNREGREEEDRGREIVKEKI
jgi:hypothetical protein